MFRGILPKEVDFYAFFEKHIALGIKMSETLLELAKTDGSIEVYAKRIKDLEHEMDEITHSCADALHRTFITPMERTDIFSLIKRLDDIGDSIDAAVTRMLLYEIHHMRPEVAEIAEILVKSTREIEKALKHLRDPKHQDAISEHCINIHQLESDGDIILRSAITKLFREGDAMVVIKWKEIVERLEKAVDRCEDVVNIIEGVVISAS